MSTQQNQRKNQRKSRNKKFKKQQIQAVKRARQTKVYVCECHSQPAKKPALTRLRPDDDNYAKGSLGKWRCGVSGLRTKVRVFKAEAATEQAAS